MDVAYPRVIAAALETTRMTERLCIVARALATRENPKGMSLSTDPSSNSRNLLTGGERLVVPTLRPPGGGSSNSPQSFYEVGVRLRPRIRQVRQQLAELPDRLRGPRLIFEASVLPNYLATSSFPGALLSVMGVQRVGTRAETGTYVTKTRREENAPTKAYLVSGHVEALSRLEQLLEATEGDLSRGVLEDVVKLQDIAAPNPVTVLNRANENYIEIGGRVAMEAVLHPVVDENGHPDQRGLAQVLKKWQLWVDELGGEVDLDWLRSHQRLTFVPVLLPRDRLDEAVLFNPLRALHPMPAMEILPPLEMRGIGGVQPMAPSERPSSERRIAVFDGGLPTTVPALSRYVSYKDLTEDAATDAGSVAHATTVASAATFGNIDPAVGLQTPPAYIDHFRIWPPPAEYRADQHMNWVLDEIIKEVRRGQHRLVSLSIGPQFNVEPDGPPHRWTVALDELASRHDVLFCVAAGNTGEGDATSRENVLVVPGDIVNGLSVGACNNHDSDVWGRAPYSSIGPGRAGARVAPQVLGCGGTPEAPFGCLIPGGQYGFSHGTSLATPAVARSLAELAHALGDRADQNVLRAFAVHHADRRPDRSHVEVGYGRVPGSLLEDLTCQPNGVTILYQDRLLRGQTMMLPLPVPSDLLSELGGRKVDIRWTLAFTSPVDISDPVDYTRAGIEVRFRPHAETFNLNLKGQAPIRVNRLEPGGPELYQYLIEQGRTPSDRPVSRGLSEYAPEAEQRVRKWETTVRVDDRLMAKSLFEPALDLHLLTRAGGGMSRATSNEELRYAMLVTVTAPAGVQLYDRVHAAAADALTPLRVEAPIIVST